MGHSLPQEQKLEKWPLNGKYHFYGMNLDFGKRLHFIVNSDYKINQRHHFG
jgi:hypothetical protein